MLKELMPKDWQLQLETAFSSPDFQKLEAFVEEAYMNHTIYPEKSHIFKAFQLTPFDQVRVVIIGQDPYHGPHQATGLSFSVPMTEKLPPSLRNIYKELYEDLGITRIHGNLEDWARQGVLMINDVLTVEAGKARSHRGKGWEKFTQAVIEKLNEKKDPVIFVLWGNDAIKKSDWIHPPHIIIKGPHPSPLSAYRGFFGSKPFSTINNNLDQPIEW